MRHNDDRSYHHTSSDRGTTSVCLTTAVRNLIHPHPPAQTRVQEDRQRGLMPSLPGPLIFTLRVRLPGNYRPTALQV